MQFVLKHRVQCLQWYITLVVSFVSYPCNEHKTHVGRPKCESDTSSVRHVICNCRLIGLCCLGRKKLLSGYRDISDEQEMKMTKILFVHKIMTINFFSYMYIKDPF